jgi:hypothetical protein
MDKPRNPIDVVQLMKQIPELPKEVQDRLDWFIDDFSYKAPEQVSYCFHKLASYIWELLDITKNGAKNPMDIHNTPWKLKILSIFSTVDEDTIKEGLKKEAEDKKI